MNERIKALRKALNLTQQEFADKLGTSRGNIGSYEVGKSAPSDAAISLICKTFNVNRSWLRSGEGEMFEELPEEDEVAAYVSELLEDDDNPLYDIIKDVMKTYNDLTPKSQEVILDFSRKLRDNMKKES